jgi:hypothetical protein
MLYTQIFSPKKNGFSEKKILPKKINKKFYLYSMQLFSADATMFSNFIVEKTSLKSCSSSAQTFYSTAQPNPQPTAQNRFFIS